MVALDRPGLLEVDAMFKQGEKITVKFGSQGTQLALVLADSAAPHSFARVIKWRDNSRRWTKPLLVRSSEVSHRGWVGRRQKRALLALTDALHLQLLQSLRRQS